MIAAPGYRESDVTDVSVPAGNYWIAYRSSPLLLMGFSGTSQLATRCNRTVTIPNLDTPWPTTFGAVSCSLGGILNVYFVAFRNP